MIQNFYNIEKTKKNKTKISDNNLLSHKESIKKNIREPSIDEVEKILNLSKNTLGNNSFFENTKIIFNEFTESDYGSLGLLDLNEKFAVFDKPNEKILSDIEWAIDKLTLEDLIVTSDENNF